MKTKLFKKVINSSLGRLLVIVVLLLIPFLYSFCFLKAFWDPYTKMKDIPVAMVNLDKGERGKEILNRIQRKNIMKMITFADEKDAVSNLYNRNVYAVIIIPKDFTGELNQVASSKRKQPIIKYLTNKKNNFITSQIYDRAVIEVQKNIENEVSSKVVTVLSDTVQSSVDKVKVIQNGFHEMNDGTGKLNDGAIQLADGAKKLNDGIATLENNYKEFTAGIHAYAYNMHKLSANYETFDSGIKQYVSGVNKAADGLDQISAGVVALGDKLGVLKFNDDFKKLYNGAKHVREQNIAQQLKEGGNKILEGSGKVKSSIGAVPAALTDKPATLVEGIHKLSNASAQVQDGIGKLADGSNQLKNGTSELTKGVNILHTEVNLATRKLDSEMETSQEKAEGLTGLGKFMKEPVILQTDHINNVRNYGTAFTPYFISLSLWVGALSLLIVLYYDAEDRFHIFSRNYYNKYSQLLAYLGLITIQATLFSIFIYSNFNLNLTNNFLFVASIFLIDASFFMMIYFFILAFGDFGKLISIVMLIIQLCASGGTFPIETAPSFFEKVYPLMPMKYSISLIKESIVDIEYYFLIIDLAVIGGLFIVFLILNLITIKATKSSQPALADSPIVEI